jgi:hypothetical protein
MARIFSPRNRRKSRYQIYSALVLLVIFLVFAYIYSPWGNSESESAESPTTMNANTSVRISDEGGVPAVSQNNMFESPVASVEARSEPEPQPIRELSMPHTEEISTKPIVMPDTEAGTLITEATALMNQSPGVIIEARDKFNKALQMSINNQQKTFVKEQLSELADKWLFSKTALPDDELCENYKVRSGDILDIIGKRHKVPYEILMEINNISRPESLKAGETIKIVKGPFHAKVSRSTFTMDIYLQNTYVKSFPVGLGKAGSETPVGLWRVEPGGKLIKPIWTNPLDGRTYYPDDEDYPLGSRWIALEGISGAAKERTGFAIHGTKEPEQIGKADSQGCIRMHNGSAVLVYNMLFPALSTVEVID